jgi:GNAT superfamily N-acetyltransferase
MAEGGGLKYEYFDMKYRKLGAEDYEDVAALFAELTGDSMARDNNQIQKVMAFAGTQIFGAEVNGSIVSMATLHLLPNLGGVRLVYGLVENVVTLRTFQKRGFGRGVMSLLIEAAWSAGAYKIMLLTGSQASASRFYEKLGFSGDSKVGMQIRNIPVRRTIV